MSKLPAPVHPAKRIDPGRIEIAPVAEADLHTFAADLYRYFPAVWWDKHELPSKRPEESIRVDRFAKRVKPWISHPDLSFVKATIKETGEIVGFANWYKPVNGYTIPNVFSRYAVDQLGFAQSQGWTDVELAEIWEAVDVNKWDGEFGDYDATRRTLMKDQPHWYLAPFIVSEEFRGQGIGSLLLRYAIDQADATDPTFPLYLEAFETARPIYAQHGFVGEPGPGKEMVMIRRGPAFDTHISK